MSQYKKKAQHRTRPRREVRKDAMRDEDREHSPRVTKCNFSWRDLINKIRSAECLRGHKKHFTKIHQHVLACAQEVSSLQPDMTFGNCRTPTNVQELVSLVFVPHNPPHLTCKAHYIAHNNSAWLDPRLDCARQLIIALELGKSSLHGLKLRLFGKTLHHKDSTPPQKKRFLERNKGCFDPTKDPCLVLETDKSDRAGRSPNNQNKYNLLNWCFYFGEDFSDLVQLKDKGSAEPKMPQRCKLTSEAETIEDLKKTLDISHGHIALLITEKKDFETQVNELLVEKRQSRDELRALREDKTHLKRKVDHLLNQLQEQHQLIQTVQVKLRMDMEMESSAQRARAEVRSEGSQKRSRRYKDDDDEHVMDDMSLPPLEKLPDRAAFMQDEMVAWNHDIIMAAQVDQYGGMHDADEFDFPDDQDVIYDAHVPMQTYPDRLTPDYIPPGETFDPLEMPKNRITDYKPLDAEYQNPYQIFEAGEGMTFRGDPSHKPVNNPQQRRKDEQRYKLVQRGHISSSGINHQRSRSGRHLQSSPRAHSGPSRARTGPPRVRAGPSRMSNAYPRVPSESPRAEIYPRRTESPRRPTAGADRVGKEMPGAERERAGADRAGDDMAGADMAGADRAGADKAGSDLQERQNVYSGRIGENDPPEKPQKGEQRQTYAAKFSYPIENVPRREQKNDQPAEEKTLLAHTINEKRVVNVDVRSTNGKAVLNRALIENDVGIVRFLLDVQQCKPDEIPLDIFKLKIPVSDLIVSNNMKEMTAEQFQEYVGAASRPGLPYDVIAYLAQMGRYVALTLALDFHSKHELDNALLIAAFLDHYDIARELLERGADPNVKTVGGWRPLLIAVLMNHRKMTQLLMEKADLEVENEGGKNVFDIAQDNENLEMLEVIVESDRIDRNLRLSIRSLVRAILERNVEQVHLLLDYNIDHTEKYQDKCALEYAYEIREDAPEVWVALADVCAPVMHSLPDQIASHTRVEHHQPGQFVLDYGCSHASHERRPLRDDPHHSAHDGRQHRRRRDSGEIFDPPEHCRHDSRYREDDEYEEEQYQGTAHVPGEPNMMDMAALKKLFREYPEKMKQLMSSPRDDDRYNYEDHI